MTKVAPFTTVLPSSATLQVMDRVMGPIERLAEDLQPTDEILVIVNGRPGYRPFAQSAPCNPPADCVIFTDGCLSPGIPSGSIVVSAYQRLSIAFPIGIAPVPALVLPSAKPSLPGDHWLAITVQDAEAVIAEGLRLETGPLALPEQPQPVPETLERQAAQPLPSPPPPPLRAHVGARELPIHGFQVDASSSTWRFTVPPRTTTIRLSSQSVQPPGDPRHLGVAICQLAIDDMAIPLESPALVRGFHRAEAGEGLTWRWTDGDALVIVPPRAGEQVLTVQITDWHLALSA
jgi:hypothetical protein